MLKSVRTWFFMSSKLGKDICTLIDEVFENIFNFIVNVTLNYKFFFLEVKMIYTKSLESID